MELHLFSTPGPDDLRWIVEACRPILSHKPDPLLAYLPLGSLAAQQWLDQTTKAFDGLARLEMINTEIMELPAIEAVLRKALAVFIPGGNTFLLNHRLNLSRLAPSLRKKIRSGLPVFAFSAGTVVCGPNILTSGDMNTVETPHFEGLDLTPYNFFVHYGEDAYLQAIQDNWLSEYHVFHDNPVILLADGAYIHASGQKIKLVCGKAWLLHKGKDKEPIEAGALLPHQP